MKPLAEMLRQTPYAGYTYSYPHKTAHRPFPAPVPLSELWAGEDRTALFLYVHVPFCQSRCGFCNLFSVASPSGELTRRYLEALRRQAERVRLGLGHAGFARMAIGGGTPTLLSTGELETLFSIAVEVMGARPREIPVSVEISPANVAAEKLALLREHGVDRVSIGVQSFDDEESAALGRMQRREDVERALATVRDAGFPTLNIDLIYGGPARTPAGWLDSIRAALRYRPEELYLYPLYVRPGTGLGRRPVASCEDSRLDAYRAGRALLLGEGYRQVSMRMFRAPHAPDQRGPAYRCQEDGMIGLGCGARSYTRAVHYSTPYALSRSRVLEILEWFVARPAAAFDAADHGFALDGEDQRRRYAILSLLLCEGLSRPDYAARFGSDIIDDLPQLGELEPLGLAEVTQRCVRLTEQGIERSDVIGPWLYSDRVCRLMADYEMDCQGRMTAE